MASNKNETPNPPVTPASNQGTLAARHDISSWSIDHVAAWAKQTGFMQAHIDILVKEMVDGRALLLLNVDKLTHHPFNLPGGPATILAQEIQNLQPTTGASLALSSNEYDIDALEGSDNTLSITLEGLKTTPWRLKRVGLCDKLCSIVGTHQYLLIRGPFASGKTSLGQLLHQHLSQSKKATVYIFTLSQSSVSSWLDCWNKQVKIPWDSVEGSEEPVYVIIDEVQLSYSYENNTYGLWKDIKRLRGTNPNVHIICIGSYGSPVQGPQTPIEFPVVVTLHPHNGIPGLAYTEEEFQELCRLFARRVNFEVDERSANYIFHLTGGHPGIVGLILNIMCHHRKDFRSKEKDLYHFLHTAGLHNSLVSTSCRGIPDFSANPALSIDKACRHVLEAPGFKVLKGSSIDIEDQLLRCLKASILIEEGGFLMFASPVVENRALAFYYGLQPGQNPENLGSFIANVVQRFSVAQLRNSESKDTQARIMEGQWQKEFYRVAVSLLPTDAFISPEYGRGQGINGQVDFYISKYEWMIETLREGLDIPAHEKRFEPGGQYASLLSVVKEWAVVDFRATKGTVKRAPHKHTYHLTFIDNFSRVKIRNPLGEKRVVPILGDQAIGVLSDRKPGTTPAKLTPQT